MDWARTDREGQEDWKGRECRCGTDRTLPDEGERPLVWAGKKSGL